MNMPGFTAEATLLSSEPTVYRTPAIKKGAEPNRVLQELELDVVEYLKCIAKGGGTFCLHRILGR